MAEGTTVQTMSGTVLKISASLPATYDSTGYGALTYTAVAKVEAYGEHGATAEVARFTPVDTADTEKLKGAVDYGTKSLVLGYLPSDAGQDILEAAMASKNRYSVKIEYPARQGESTGEIHYLDALISKRTWQDGDVSAVRKVAVDLEICRKPVVVAAT